MYAPHKQPTDVLDSIPNESDLKREIGDASLPLDHYVLVQIAKHTCLE